MLFACVYAPDFIVQAALRPTTPVPGGGATAAAVVDGPESLRRVVACNAGARSLGVRGGMTRGQAGLCPGVLVKNRSLPQEEAAATALLDCAMGFSPSVESTHPGQVILDLTGMERLLGTAAELGCQLARSAEACGFSVNVALGPNPDAAWCAARGFPGITVLTFGNVAEQLGSLPVEVLQPTPEILDTLDSWGIRDLRSLAALPALAITQRLSQYGLHLQRLARGEVWRELVPFAATATFQESVELEEALELLEPLGFLLHRMLEQLMARLAARSLATDQLELELGLEIHRDQKLQEGPADSAAPPLFCRALKLAVPTQDAKILLRLLQLDLATHPPRDPVIRISLRAWPARARLTQAGLFQPLAPEPAKLEVTMARLRGVVGESDALGRPRVGFPLVADTHRPDSFQVLRLQEAPVAPSDKGCGDGPVALRLAMRRFRPPLETVVEHSHGCPQSMTFERKRMAIVQAWGPWRSSGDWWGQAGNWQREEWDIQISLQGELGLYRIFRDLKSERWFMDGMYD
jgi:protein ImuB